MKRKIVRLMMLFVLASALASPLMGRAPIKQKGNGIMYHNGQIMLGSVHVYFIFYGNWVGSDAPQALTEFILNLGGSTYHNISTTYHDGTGSHAINSLLWGRNIEDPYSRGTNLSEADVEAVVAGSIKTGQLPLDPNGIYFVMASADVNATGLCTERCEFHDYTTLFGVSVKYAFVGDPQRCPRRCASQFFDRKGRQIGLPPSTDFAIDAMISWIAHDLSGTITSPELDGWFDRSGLENSDKCVNKFGRTYYTDSGAVANVRLGGRDYLLQQNWVNAEGGYCSLAFP